MCGPGPPGAAGEVNGLGGSTRTAASARKGLDTQDLGVAVREERAQGTLEYALTVLALMAVVAGLALLWRAGERSGFVQLVENAASHALDAGGALDIALF